MKSIKLSNKSGFTLIEILVAIGIVLVLGFIIVTTFVSFRKNQSLSLDTQTITTVLSQARNQTISSKNSTSYGVHFGTSKITLFTGTVYNSLDTTNEDFNLSSTDTILSVGLNGGGNDVIFERLTGETSRNGTVVVSSPGIAQSKTVTIYKTGLVESQ